jgi:hypothetical protein
MHASKQTGNGTMTAEIRRRTLNRGMAALAATAAFGGATGVARACVSLESVPAGATSARYRDDIKVLRGLLLDMEAAADALDFLPETSSVDPERLARIGEMHVAAAEAILRLQAMRLDIDGMLKEERKRQATG